jgi:hypothetical protein
VLRKDDAMADADAWPHEDPTFDQVHSAVVTLFERSHQFVLCDRCTVRCEQSPAAHALISICIRPCELGSHCAGQHPRVVQPSVQLRSLLLYQRLDAELPVTLGQGWGSAKKPVIALLRAYPGRSRRSDACWSRTGTGQCTGTGRSESLRRLAV